MELYRDDSQAWYDNYMEQKQRKHEDLRRKWIRRVLDGDSQELGPNFIKDRRNLTDEKMIEIFEDRLAKDLIDVPHDFYDEQLKDEDPDYLIQVF